MNKIFKLVLLIILVLCCIACDQTSKKIAKEKLENKPAISFFNDLLRLQYVENNGAFLSLGSNLNNKLHFYFLILIPFIVLVSLLIYIIIKINFISNLQFLSFTLILSGGLSNLYDRFFNNRMVIDFINFGILNLRTGIMNFADLYIVIGSIILCLSYYLEKYQKNKN